MRVLGVLRKDNSSKYIAQMQIKMPEGFLEHNKICVNTKAKTAPRVPKGLRPKWLKLRQGSKVTEFEEVFGDPGKSQLF